MPSDMEHNSEDDSKEESGSVPQPASSTNGKEAMTKRRTKTGCLTCRKRRIKCGEERPICKNCVKSKRECAGYNHPLIYKQHGLTNPQSAVTPSLRIEQGWSHPQADDTSNVFTYVDFPQQTANAQSGMEGMHLGEAQQWFTDMRPIMLPQAEPTSIDPVGKSEYSQMPQWSHLWPPLPNENVPAALPVSERFSSFSNMDIPPLNTSATQKMQESRGNPTLSQSERSPPIIADHERYSNLGFVQRPSFASSIKLSSRRPQRIHDPSATVDEEYEDPDDPWDVDMNENDDQKTISAPGGVPPSGLFTLSDQFQALAYQQSLSESSPLLDERSQKIFRHFIAVTGPCMGTFDRHDGPNIDGTPRVIWTHGLPAMAFKCSALAHAILAIGAMHMFKLNSGSENTAVKHFTHALRRVGKALGNPRQRLEVSTLATVLLLGYYEVMTGDHSRWNLHLSGAGKLVMEHNFAGLIRAVTKYRATTRTNIAPTQVNLKATSQDEHVRATNLPIRLFDDNDWKVDQGLVSKLMGFNVDYDSQIQPKFELENSIPDIDQTNIDDWRVLTELYWWYCRQDVFMSMLSGDPLLLPYSHWKYCSPRGPIGNADNPHTTHDHMWLIIARLTDFGGKDRKRKQRVVNTQGGQWIPAPGFFESMQSPDKIKLASAEKNVHQTNAEIRKPTRPSANEGRARTAKQPPGMAPSQPSFYGMLPPANGPIFMPSSFNVMKAELQGSQSSSPTDTESPQTQDLETQTRLALEEHTSIVKAFDMFESYLGSEFQPLISSDIQITTPFGPALQYKSPRIAVLWAFYYVGRILLRRMHPHSPPAAMVSAGVNARATHEYAQTIGRICGGLIAQHSYLLQAGHVNTMLSAALMESTFSLLFAAVQYHDPVQRGWTIGKLSEIAQQTGWQTSAAVAAACESMWEKAGLAGKGPPYQRTLDRNNADARLNVKLRRAQESVSPTTNLSPAEEHESRFVSHDRNLIDRHASTRAHWALGLLSVEEDLQRISLNENE